MYKALGSVGCFRSSFPNVLAFKVSSLVKQALFAAGRERMGGVLSWVQHGNV